MNVIYVISKYLTVVGAVLKGFWEHIVCRMLAVPVQDARYLQANELCGHVEHDFTKRKGVTFFLCYLPGFLNRLFGYGMFIGSYTALFILKLAPSTALFAVCIVLLYLGTSLLCNNAPLYEDALNNWDLFYGKKEEKTNIIVKILAFIPSVYFIVSAWLEKHAVSLLIFIAAILAGIFVL